jgi:hypothetical protein
MTASQKIPILLSRSLSSLLVASEEKSRIRKISFKSVIVPTIRTKGLKFEKFDCAKEQSSRERHCCAKTRTLRRNFHFQANVREGSLISNIFEFWIRIFKFLTTTVHYVRTRIRSDQEVPHWINTEAGTRLFKNIEAGTRLFISYVSKCLVFPSYTMSSLVSLIWGWDGKDALCRTIDLLAPQDKGQTKGNVWLGWATIRYEA